MKNKNFLVVIIILAFNIQNFTVIHLMETSLNEGLNGLGLTFTELQGLRDGTLEKQIKNQINTLEEKQILTLEEKDLLHKLRREYELISNAAKKMLWHLKTPTVGIDLKNDSYPLTYLYTPHFFSLWELAPHQGAGIKVASIDTGVAAFSLPGATNLRKHRDLEMPVILQNNYNIISQNGLDPIKQLAQILKPYLNVIDTDYKESDLEKYIPLWVLEYKQKRTTKGLYQYLKKIGKQEHIEEAVEAFISGDHGINAHANQFTINQLTMHNKNDFVIENLLPLVSVAPTKKLSSFLSHGSHTFGLIGATLDDNKMASEKGIVGIAPQANVFMIKAFSANTMESDKATLMAAIEKSLNYGAQVVNLSLKVSDQLDMLSKSTKKFELLINQIPYAVAASGNNGDPLLPHYAGHILGYPARFSKVPFTVGAYGIKKSQAFIPDFSQYEKNVGPIFVAPGIDILSAGLLPNQVVDSAYLFLDGTSMACSIMSGFVALMLGEFKNDFSREQLITVCYKSGVKLAKNAQWQERTLLGALDMRTALFMLHVLKSIKNKNLVDNFSENFNRLLAAIHILILAPVKHYGKTILNNISFTDEMFTFIDQINLNMRQSLAKYYVPRGTNKKEALQSATDYFVDIIEYLLNRDDKNTTYPYPSLGFYVNDQILSDLEFILKDPSYKFSFSDNKNVETTLKKKLTL